MSNLPYAEIQIANAETFAKVIGSRYGVDLAYDKSGAAWLDEFIHSRGEDLTGDTVFGLTRLAGSFLGECIIKTYEGSWDEENERVQLADTTSIDPFWMFQTCQDNRAMYSVEELFKAVPKLALVCIGGLYSYKDEENESPSVVWKVSKVLAVDHMAVHLRIYGNTFDHCPSHVDPSSLNTALPDLTSWMAEGSPISELAVGHLPISHDGFWQDNPKLLQVEPVTEEELVGYHCWLGK